MGILIIHADHDTTASEWERIRDLVTQVGGTIQQVETATSPTESTPVAPSPVATTDERDERKHDPLGQYDDATWQSFSPQKRGSIKRHRNGNDAPFVAQHAPVAQPTAAPTGASDAMTALFAAAGIDQPAQPAATAVEQPTAETVVRRQVDQASDLTPGQRTDLGIWANEKLADPKKVALVNTFLAGKVTLTQVSAYPTKGGKSNLAKDMARVAKFDLVNA